MYGPRATQVSRLLGALGPLGWQTTAICLAPRPGGPHWFDGAATPPAGVELVRVPSPEEWMMVRAAFRVAPWLRDHPDTKRVWVAPATRAALDVVSAADVAGLITFAQPWSDHSSACAWAMPRSCRWRISATRGPTVPCARRQRSIWKRMEATSSARRRRWCSSPTRPGTDDGEVSRSVAEESRDCPAWVRSSGHGRSAAAARSATTAAARPHGTLLFRHSHADGAAACAC